MQRCSLPIVGGILVAVSQPTWFPWLLGRDEMRPNSKPVSDSAFDARIRVVCEPSQSVNLELIS